MIPEDGAVGALALEGDDWKVTSCHKLELDR